MARSQHQPRPQSVVSVRDLRSQSRSQSRSSRVVGVSDVGSDDPTVVGHVNPDLLPEQGGDGGRFDHLVVLDEEHWDRHLAASARVTAVVVADRPQADAQAAVILRYDSVIPPRGHQHRLAARNTMGVDVAVYDEQTVQQAAYDGPPLGPQAQPPAADTDPRWPPTGADRSQEPTVATAAAPEPRFVRTAHYRPPWE